MERGMVTEYSEKVKKPQNHNNDHNNIQNCLYGTSHWDESVDEPEKNTNNYQYQYHLK